MQYKSNEVEVTIDGEKLKLNKTHCNVESIILIPGCSSVEAGVSILNENNKYYMELSTWGGEHKVEITKEFFESCVKEFEGNKRDVKCNYNCQ